eukprot:TRINITY_DN54342_c0_g1_i1.p1 TRINITY_DN54342_c0_g1~~TRINITY_DN54342_c0_g1_i1.p1  ORF type:complete len:176 (+),score=57.59 TRINITY_DN54342_c0_g1_i1:3-530(+)
MKVGMLPKQQRHGHALSAVAAFAGLFLQCLHSYGFCSASFAMARAMPRHSQSHPAAAALAAPRLLSAPRLRQRTQRSVKTFDATENFGAAFDVYFVGFCLSCIMFVGLFAAPWYFYFGKDSEAEEDASAELLYEEVEDDELEEELEEDDESEKSEVKDGVKKEKEEVSSVKDGSR